MGLPKISIEFKSKGVSAIQRGERGIVQLILKDDGVSAGQHKMNSINEIPEGLSAQNKAHIERAWIGGQRPPKQVNAYVIQTSALDYADAFSFFETVKFDYLAIPEYDKATEQNDVVAFIKHMRDNLGRKCKVVLPDTPADYEGVINFTTNQIKVGENIYSAGQYASRIAGLLAGTPLTISATYQVLPEVEDVEHFSKDELDSKIDNGEFILFHDGEKVKVGRAVNSLVTTSQEKGEDWKKIKIVDILDLIYTDIHKTADDNYIGKYANSYDNKVLLINAIQGYLLQLELDGLLEVGKSNVALDLESQIAYLKSIGQDVESMSEQEIKEANTKDKVFLAGNIKVLDAIEDITMKFNM